MAKPGRPTKPKSVTLQAVALGATPRRAQMAGENIDLIRETNKRDPIRVRLADWPLAMLRSRNVIDVIQEAAGERYFEDYYDAGLVPSGAMDYAKAKVDTSRYDFTPEFKLEAQDRFNDATLALKPKGPLTEHLAKVVRAVCLDGIHPREIPPHPSMRQNQRDRETATFFLLQIGLNELAIHYGMKRRLSTSAKS